MRARRWIPTLRPGGYGSDDDLRATHELRASAISEVDKGAKFERLMKAFLLTDPVYAE
jgi:hypothetical protein